MPHRWRKTGGKLDANATLWRAFELLRDALSHGGMDTCPTVRLP
jgi:hypothetical protein